MFISMKLKTVDPQDIAKRIHHRFVKVFCLGEITLRLIINVIINIDEYVISPASDNGILRLLFLKSVPQGLFKTVSHPLLIPGHDNEFNNPQFFKVIDPVSAIPIVLKIAINIFGHFKFFSFLLFIIFIVL